MKWLRVEANAKVNLGLAVVARRPDGYHEIDTIFQTVSLCDSLRIAGPAETSSVVVSGRAVPDDETNLALRAARVLEEHEAAPPVAIELEKRIPVAAGLGGGSSDAAAVLNGVNQLFGLELPAPRLEELALSLGSDVPFLVRGGTARGRGRGERLTRLRDITDLWMVLAVPPLAVSASQGYATARIGLTESERLIRLSCSAIQEERAEGLGSLLCNDLEAGVVLCCPEVAAARAALREAGAAAIVMSGSGPTVIGLTRSEEDARSTASQLSRRDVQIHVACTTPAASRVTETGVT